MADDVQLTDLEVIQRYSLAVRGATAPRAELIASLQADLEWLRGGRRAAPPVETAALAGPVRAAVKRAAKKAPAKGPAARPTTA
ncbi:MAG: hypothetical protein JWN08_1151 [Frankiales bacterium]|nr:hypothetical protein [Frankiales bacterium]